MLENVTNKIFWFLKIQTDQPIQSRRHHLVLINQKKSILSRKEIDVLKWLWAKSKWDFTQQGSRKESFQEFENTVLHNRMPQLIVSRLSSVLAACRSFWSSPWVENEFCITSEQIYIVACWLILQGHPVWGRAVVRPYCFHFWTMAQIVLIKILSSLEFF